MPNMNDNKLLTLQEAAAILRKHPRTLTRWHDAGILRLIPLPKGYLIERTELDRFIAETDRMERMIMQDAPVPELDAESATTEAQ